MYKRFQNRFRQDLRIESTFGVDGRLDRYIVTDPLSGNSFEFTEEEYFLCQAMDGMTSVEEIIYNLQNTFKISLSYDDFASFSQELKTFNLLEVYKRNLTKTIKLFSVADPGKILAFWAKFLSPLRFLVWSLIVIFPLGLVTFLRNQPLFWVDSVSRTGNLQFFLLVYFCLSLLNFLGKWLQGSVCLYYGGLVQEFNLDLIMGCVPRFNLDRQGFWAMERRSRLWIFGSPLLLWLAVMAFSLFVWIGNRNAHFSLATGALVFFYSGLISFLVDINPLWFTASDGYGWFVSYFQIGSDSLKRSMEIWRRTILFKPLPKAIPLSTRILLFLFGIFVILFSIAFFIYIAYITFTTLVFSLKGTGAVIFCAILILFTVNIMSNFNWKPESIGHAPPPPIELPSDRRQNSSKDPLNGFSQFLKNYWLLLLLAGGAIIIALLPYRFNAGGSIQLLPPKEQPIESDVVGTLTKVFFPGGDGKFIKAGQVIAQLDSPELQNSLLTAQDKVTQQAANVRQAQADLQQLLTTPRETDIAVAKEKVGIARSNVGVAENQVEVARSNVGVSRNRVRVAEGNVILAINEVEVARSNVRVAANKVAVARGQIQLEQTKLITGISQADFSRREAERYKESYQEGVYSLQQYENQLKNAETDTKQLDTFKASIQDARNQLEVSKQDLEVAKHDLAVAKQQFLVSQQDLAVSRQQFLASQHDLGVAIQQLNTAKSQLSEEIANYNKVVAGPHPDEIQAAREKVQSSQADLKRQKQDLKYYQDQVKRTQLRMPFDGILSSANLTAKIGQYINKGDTFATATLKSEPIAEIKVPENVLDVLAPNNKVNIRFYTFYNTLFTGKVMSVQTVTEKDTTYGQEALEDQSGKSTKYLSESAGQVLKVTIKIDDPDQQLRPGMTGYAKIEGPNMPVFIAFTRPIVRFFQVDFWSWFP
jgi:multidrug resistance efflux pump